MPDISCRQINLARPDPARTFEDLNDFMNRRIVRPCPYLGASVVTANGEFALLNSTNAPGNVAKLIASPLPQTHSGVCAVPIPIMSTATDTVMEDDLGNYLNLVEIRDANTHEAITSGGLTVFGLIHCFNGMNDGDPIGASGAENLQISFVTVTTSGISLVSVSADVRFTLNRLYLEGRRPAIHLASGVEDLISFEGAEEKYLTADRAYFTVSSPFAADEDFSVANGSGAISGSCVFNGVTVDIRATEAEFLADNMVNVYRGGVKQHKTDDITWVDSTHISFNDPLSVGEDIEIIRYRFSNVPFANTYMVTSGIEDQDADEDSLWVWQVPNDTFSGAHSGHVKTYEAQLSSGASLPGWLSFEAATATFLYMPDAGTPGTYEIEVTCVYSDGALEVARVTDTFNFTLNSI